MAPKIRPVATQTERADSGFDMVADLEQRIIAARVQVLRSAGLAADVVEFETAAIMAQAAAVGQALRNSYQKGQP